ncbi:calcium/calmodulin-dependent 3',5'-cyclic nucleotide phosphodiesterase 1B isoform A [Patagioenas fasciata monilis]|uniref:Calcium/calmodulin-dependent 3',5'-cyclic nucleotide phosphodiesterase 1B isoform A n=1 Tax=Patagioenas fasciata monilis TaxID=372326 RepID=A0A1V4JKL9_PATFA|nr:calcium/calmodulin-dependent 3',5'-cyclic nucleotide phosphodiesterase 1B isoform A [Patagioenas fasciata monilis]
MSPAGGDTPALPGRASSGAMEPPRSLPGLQPEREGPDPAGGCCPSPLEIKSAPSKKIWVKLRALLRFMVKQLETGEVNVEELRRNLEYAASLLEAVCIDETRQMLDTEDELRAMGSDAAVPSEVRDWLAATFTQQARAKGRRAEEKPKFRSIVHAVQAGIFVERMFRRTYTAVGPSYSTSVLNCLKVPWGVGGTQLSQGCCPGVCGVPQFPLPWDAPLGWHIHSMGDGTQCYWASLGFAGLHRV